jgi:hypothetical protein
MSVYAVNSFCRRVVHDAALRAALADDPEAALRTARPALDEDEVEALLRGDVGELSLRGCNHFLLHQLGRWRVLGLDLPTYAKRIRAPHHGRDQPATGELIDRFPRGGPEDVDAAVRAAECAQPEWRALAPLECAALVGRIADAVEAHAGELLSYTQVKNVNVRF